LGDDMGLKGGTVTLGGAVPLGVAGGIGSVEGAGVGGVVPRPGSPSGTFGSGGVTTGGPRNGGAEGGGRSTDGGGKSTDGGAKLPAPGKVTDGGAVVEDEPGKETLGGPTDVGVSAGVRGDGSNVLPRDGSSSRSRHSARCASSSSASSS
jgi:hypothetical protein